MQEAAGKWSSFFRHREISTKACEIFGASHLYSLLGAVLQNEGPEGNCFVKCLKGSERFFTLLAAVWLYPDLIFSHN